MSLSQRIYYVNTLNKINGSNENFTYSFQIPQKSGFDRVVVLSASIPNTFYLIQEGYNTFTLRENSTDVTITIPPGNYSAKVFALVVVPLMNAASPNSWIYSMALPNQNQEASTGKFNYTVTGNSSQPSIICTANVNEQLGFLVNSTNTFIDNQLTSLTTLNFGAESTLFIHSDIADNGDSDVLQEIYAGNTQSLSYITYQCSTPEMYSKALQTNQSSLFRFSLTNEKQQVLNLHGVDMQLTLCMYKKDDTNELIRKYIQYKVHSDPQA
jgi:hypothetical protein